MLPISVDFYQALLLGILVAQLGAHLWRVRIAKKHYDLSVQKAAELRREDEHARAFMRARNP